MLSTTDGGAEPLKRRRKPRTKPSSPRTLPAVAEAAEAGGWAYVGSQTLDPNGKPRMELIFTRNDEEITIVYLENVETAEERPTYTIGERHIKLRNVAAARDQLVKSVEEANKNRVRRTRGKAKKFENEVNPQKKVPFDINEATEEEIRNVVAGRRIRWWSQIADRYEDAIISKNPKQFRIEEAKNGKRQMTFCDTKGGFRTIYLERLMTVEGTGKR